MKIVIVENPRPPTLEHYNDVANAPLSASLNSGYALAVARRCDWDTAHLDFTFDSGDVAGLADRILAEEGNLILLHWVYSWGHEELVRRIIALLKTKGSAPVGAFGLFPTLSCRRLLTFAAQLDFILVGEFENTLADLLSHYGQNGELSALPGIALRHSEFVSRPLTGDLASLPIPDDVGANCSYRTMNIAASRGCYGNCGFCFINGFYDRSRRRVRDRAALEHELLLRLPRRTISNLYFVDPTFIGQGTQERERVMSISRLAQELALPFGFETRVDSIDKALCAALAKNGASSVFLGIESGCDAVLTRIGKQINTDQIRRAVRAVRENGIRLSIGFIMFEADSTLAELRESYTFLENLGLLTDHELTANLLYHNQIVLYGSTAWERFECQQRLLIDDRLPFEAHYRFRDERVGQVCSVMGRLTSDYFRGIDSLRRSAVTPRDGLAQRERIDSLDTDGLNELLKEAFTALCSAAVNASGEDLGRIELSLRQQLEKMLTV